MASTGLTVRSIIVGSVVGVALCASNMFFGLQSGWTTMGSIQSALVSYGIFTALSVSTVKETVMAQTLAVSTATMPIAGGFVGVVPALTMLGDAATSWRDQLVWCTGLAFFGVFVAAPLRKRLIVTEKLCFPSGQATAALVKVLHRTDPKGEEFSAGIWLLRSFGLALMYGLLTVAAPGLSKMPIFGPRPARWGWTLCLSPAYMAQGALFGPKSGVSMLLGGLLGFGLLGPLVGAKHWAPSSDPQKPDGPLSYTLWLAVAVMLGESAVVLVNVLAETLLKRRPTNGTEGARLLTDAEEDDEATKEGVPFRLWFPGLLLSSFTCIATLVWASDYLTVIQAILAVLCAMVVSLLAVRALGETDMNPVSAVGKVSQILFAIAAPKNVVANLVAGAVAEAGAAQAGDLMQDLKTGYILGIDPVAQFYAQLLGSFISIFSTVALYRLYTSVFTVPSSDFPVPTAFIWLDFANLCADGGALDGYQNLPLSALIAFFVGTVCAACPVLGVNPVALAIGLYLTPRFSIPRVIGALGADLWRRLHPASHSKLLLILASGFVLGEGIASILTALALSASSSL